MSFDGFDGVGKQTDAALAVAEGRNVFGDYGEEGVVSSVRRRMTAISDDIMADNVTGPYVPDASCSDEEPLPSIPVPRLVSDFREVRDHNIEEEIEELLGFYEAIYSAADEGEGMKTAHALFMESLYPSAYLPLIREISTYVDEDGSANKAQLNVAMDSFIDAMRPVKNYAEKEGISLYDAFLEVYNDALGGGNIMMVQLRRAKEEAYKCFKKYRSLVKDEASGGKYDLAMSEYEELDKGLGFAPGFMEKLNDPETKAVVVSLDFNSTFNSSESYPTVELISRVQREVHAFARVFRRKYPEKELVLAINTGRPGQYAWGVAESAFCPIPELRKVAVAESGGVILENGLNTGMMRVAVENPVQWKAELDHIREYLLSRIVNPDQVVIEPKMSMLSIRLAEQGKNILKTKDGHEVTPQWVGEQIQKYFEYTDKYLDGIFRELMKDIAEDLPQLQEYTVNAVKAYNNPENGGGRLNGKKKKILSGLDEVMALIAETHQQRIEEIKGRIAVVESMYEKGNLVANYNPTAGYVDIGHRDINKFSTLMGYVTKNRGLVPDEVLYVQIGDSTTDILPENKTGRGEPNEGADKAYLVAVNNCNEKMRNAVRHRGEHGVVTKNPAVLGTESLFKGLKAALTR